MTPEEIKLANDKDKKIAGFLKVGYVWISELFTGLVDKLVKALNKDIYRIHIDNPPETDLSKIEKSLNEIAGKETIIKVDAPDLEFLKSIKKIEGIDGYTPIKGKDYFTEEEIADFIKKITPKKGVDYFDGEDGRKILFTGKNPPPNPQKGDLWYQS